MNSKELLEKLVGFASVSSDSNLELVDFVARYLAQFGVVAKVMPSSCGKKANLWACLGPMRDGGLLLSGHSDVVPVVGQPWDTPAFKLTEKHGRLYGRGSCDMKGFVASVLATVPHFLRATLHRPVYIALTFDEEVGCFGADELISQMGVSLPMPAMAIVGEPSLMQPITAHKGLCAYHTTITGFDVHSSLSHLGASAVRAAAQITQYLYDLSDELATGDLCPNMQMPAHSTINVGVIKGGQAGNIVARDAHLTWEYRFIPGAQPDWAHNQVQKYVQERVLPKLHETAVDATVVTRRLAHVPSFLAGDESVVVSLVKQLTGQALTSRVPYGAEAGQYQAVGIETVICGPGSIEQAHQPNEFIDKTELAKCDVFLQHVALWAQTTNVDVVAA
jgi:acetylornithine deacetylase